MKKTTNHPPALSTDPGCEHCYRGRELIDVALGTRVKFDERTYGATWQPCRFCVQSEELKMALAFAHLEVRELQVGRRTLAECPGIENVAKAIEARKVALAEVLG